MPRFFAILYAVLILLPFQVYSQNAAVSIALFDYYPFSLKDSTDKGYAFDIAKAALEQEGYTATSYFLPLIRAIKETTDCKYDIILGLNPSHTDAIQFSKSPITSLRFIIWGRKDLNWKYDSIDRLKEVDILTVSGFDYTSADKAYQEYINKKPENVRALFGHSAIQRAFKLIDAKRADIFSLDIDQATVILKSMGMTERFKSVGELKSFYLGFFGVSQVHPQKEALIKAFEKGMIKIRKRGTLSSIIKYYGEKYNLKHLPL